MEFLLDRFGHDEAVAQTLSGGLGRGLRIGPESVRIQGQSDSLDTLIRDATRTRAVRTWARVVRTSLAERLLPVLQQEAKRGY